MTPTAVPPEPTSEHMVGGIPLASLVRDYHRQMVNFARTMVSSPTIAEEAVQEAWVQVIQSSDSFEGRSSVATWLFGIVKNTASRYRRRDSRIRAHEVLATEEIDPLSGRMHPPGHPDAGHWSGAAVEAVHPRRSNCGGGNRRFRKGGAGCAATTPATTGHPARSVRDICRGGSPYS